MKSAKTSTSYGVVRASRFALQVVVSTIFTTAIFVGLLFLPAGTGNWWRAWFFVAVVLVATVMTLLSAFRGHEDLLSERFKPPLQKGQPFADKIVVLSLGAAFCDSVIFIPLDVF
jgi:hypothetical protein